MPLWNTCVLPVRPHVVARCRDDWEVGEHEFIAGHVDHQHLLVEGGSMKWTDVLPRVAGPVLSP